MTPSKERSFNLPTKESEIDPSTGRPLTKPQLLKIPFEITDALEINHIGDCVSSIYEGESIYFEEMAAHYTISKYGPALSDYGFQYMRRS